METYHAAQYGALRKCFTKRIFIPHAILNDDDAGLGLVDCRCQLFWHRRLVNGLVHADHIVVFLSSLGRRFQHCTMISDATTTASTLRTLCWLHDMISMVHTTDMQALEGKVVNL